LNGTVKEQCRKVIRGEGTIPASLRTRPAWDSAFEDLLPIDSYLLRIAFFASNDSIGASRVPARRGRVCLLALVNACARCRSDALARICERARIRKYLNLIAGHDRYIAAVISVLITPGPSCCRSVERGHVRVTSRGIAVRNGKVETARNRAPERRERFMPPPAHKYSMRGAALIRARAPVAE